MMKNVQEAAACLNAIFTVVVKWLMAVIVRHLLSIATSAGSVEIDDIPSSRVQFWRIIFLQDLTFYQVVLLCFIGSILLVLTNATMSSLALIRAHRNSQLLRRRLISSSLMKKMVDSDKIDKASAESLSEGDSVNPMSVPSLLIRQVTIIENFQAYHQLWLKTEYLVVVLCLGLTFVFTWNGALVALAMFTCGRGAAAFFDHIRKKSLDAIEKLVSVINSHLLDVLKNADQVIVAQTQEYEMVSLAKLEARLDPYIIESAKLKALSDFFQIGFSTMVPPLIAVVSWVMMANQSQGDAINTAFSVIASLLLLDEAHKSIVHLVFIEEKKQEAAAAEAKIVAYLGEDYRNGGDQDSLVEDITSTRKAVFDFVPEDSMNELILIRLEDITVWYQSRNHAVIESFSQTFEGGKIYGIVGDSGCGKSSILKVLAGILPIRKGKVTYKGRSSENLKVAYMAQASASTLFARSVRENIAYGEGSISDEQIWDALQKAEIDDYVRSLPFELCSILDLGENGVSGGERQRLQLARLFCTSSNADVVLIDEGLSELDPSRRKRIQSKLKEFLSGKTAFLVTHHSSVLDICDEVHDMSKVPEKGPEYV